MNSSGIACLAVSQLANELTGIKTHTQEEKVRLNSHAWLL